MSRSRSAAETHARESTAESRRRRSPGTMRLPPLSRAGHRRNRSGCSARKHSNHLRPREEPVSHTDQSTQKASRLGRREETDLVSVGQYELPLGASSSCITSNSSILLYRRLSLALHIEAARLDHHRLERKDGAGEEQVRQRFPSAVVRNGGRRCHSWTTSWYFDLLDELLSLQTVLPPRPRRPPSCQQPRRKLLRLLRHSTTRENSGLSGFASRRPGPRPRRRRSATGATGACRSTMRSGQARLDRSLAKARLRVQAQARCHCEADLGRLLTGLQQVLTKTPDAVVRCRPRT